MDWEWRTWRLLCASAAFDGRVGLTAEVSSSPLLSETWTSDCWETEAKSSSSTNEPRPSAGQQTREIRHWTDKKNDCVQEDQSTCCFPGGAEGEVQLSCVSVYNLLDAAFIEQRLDVDTRRNCSRALLHTEALTGRRRGDVEWNCRSPFFQMCEGRRFIWRSERRKRKRRFRL